MAKDIKVSEVVAVEDGNIVVRGTAGETAFEARTLRWGSKMLMHVTGGDFDRGTRVSIGHHAKAAVKAAGMTLPEAVLKRPRKAKEAEVVGPTVVTLEAPVNSEAMEMMAKLDLVLGDDGFFGLEAAV
jgi:hypothetical protein